jgi:predicted phage baseplate assembly protein
MPLSDHDPVIDDRRYDDIVAEIRTRIARYTPEWQPVWSDVNDNDPGITLAQVFAWLSDMLLYRMAKVPELNYLKFLELIGIELQPARPAMAEVAFAVAAGTPTPSVTLPARTQVGARGDDGTPLVFETLRPLEVVACALASVQCDDGAQYRDMTDRNTQASAAWAPFGELPRAGGALTLGLAFPAGHPNEASFPALQLDLAIFTAPLPGNQPLVRECGATSDSRAPARLQWEGWTGTAWTPVDPLEDDTLALTRDGHVRLRVPASAGLARDFMGAYGATSASTGAAQPPLFWLRGRLVAAQFERTPRLLAVRLGSVPVEQVQTVERELLGGTDGSRRQQWQLENAPVVPGSLVVQIDDGTGPQDWRAVSDLLGAGRADMQLEVDWASGLVVAGDGEHGAIPVANPANPDANVVALVYRYGGGQAGNVAAGAISQLLSPVAGIDPAAVTNLFAASGGRDEERLDDAKIRARLALRARDRAVTPDDFELLATQAGNVARARALPLAHPQFPGVQVPGAITVIVVPDDGGAYTGLDDAPPPMPSPGLLRIVCDYLDARRLIGTELFVTAPTYVDVAVAAQVAVEDDASPSTVRVAIEGAIAGWLHPLTGGDDGQGWPFGGALRYSKLVQRVFAAGGVDSVPSLVLTVDGIERPACKDVAIASIAPNALLRLTSVEVETLSIEDAAALEG